MSVRDCWKHVDPADDTTHYGCWINGRYAQVWCEDEDRWKWLVEDQRQREVACDFATSRTEAMTYAERWIAGTSKKEGPMKIARYTVVFDLALGSEDGVEEHHGVGDKAVTRVASKLAGYIADRDPLCTFEIVRREIVDVESDEGGFTPAQGIERSFENDTDGLLADIASLIRPTQEEA